MHRAKANYCTVRDLMMGIKNLQGAVRFPLQSRPPGCATPCKSPACTQQCAAPAGNTMQSRNDRVKLLLLKLRLCRTVLLLSGANQRKHP